MSAGLDVAAWLRLRSLAGPDGREELATALAELADAMRPVWCRSCGGSGGSVADGNCDRCQGSRVDPDDPESPL